MELEFDKEMDAILRRSGRHALKGVLVGDDPSPQKPKHLDADAIAAFVENALPAPTRRLYMEHFADCGRCRKLLSTSILMKETAAMAAAPAAEVIAAGVAVPWYQRLFKTPNLAIAMGALVLAFSGVLGFMLLQNRSDTSVAMAPPIEEEVQRGPYASSEPPATSSANVATNTAANLAAAPASNAVALPTVGTESKTLGRTTAPADGDRSGEVAAAKPEADKAFTVDGLDVAREVPKLSKAAPPPAPVVTQSAPGMVGGLRAEDERKEKDDSSTMAKKAATEDSRYRRDLPAAPAKSGPVRGAGPVQSQTNQIQNIGEMPVTRNVGGKTFDNRSGAWYDRAYRNQATTNYRRGTAEYRQLDSGLRSIADNLGGTVVLVWKNKAYRIN